MSTIKISGKEYKAKQTIRAIFLWEQISDKQFAINTLLDNYLYYYCILLANNPDFMGWDEFIDVLDNDPTILIQLSKILTEQAKLEKLLNPDSEDDEANPDKKKA